MPIFTYSGKDRAGQAVHSMLESESRFSALATLHGSGLTVTAIEEDGPGRIRAAAPPRRTRLSVRVAGSISLADKSMFCRQLAVSVSAGVPLREALESIADEMDNPAFRGILRDVLNALNDGKSFSDAIGSHARAFDALYVSLIRVAEESGCLPQTLEEMAAGLEKQQRLENKIRSMAAYPAFIAAFFGVMTLVMTLVILPRFQVIFAGFGSGLPWLTRVVFGANEWLIRFSPLIVAGMLALAAGWVLYGRTRQGRRLIDGLKLRLPLFGNWIRLVSVARFCRNLSMMVRGGVPIAHAIEITSATCGNAVLTDALLVARDRVVSGAEISTSIGRTGVFPRLVVQMIHVGETTGKLPEVLEKVSETYEERVEGSMMVAMSLFEPVVITLFGGVILILVMAVYMPIFTVASRVH